jgi:single-stranded-DNA-specific exonuclease
MARWVQSRGLVAPEAIQNFFSPKLAKLTPPLSLQDMDLAVGRLTQAFERNETVCVYGDYDLDGTSGIALLVFGLRGLGFATPRMFARSMADCFGSSAAI